MDTTTTALLGAVCLLLLAIYLLKPSAHTPAAARASSAGRVTAQLVVLGDIGRSPRMQYHALSLARRGAVVDVVGYRGMFFSVFLSPSLSVSVSFSLFH